jgi:hypothetical protein
VKLSESARKARVAFDDANLVSHAGLVPVMALAEQCDLVGIMDERVRLPGHYGARAGDKVATVVAGMLAGADSFDDLDVLRHGGMGSLFTRVYAPSTLGEFSRAFTHGHVSQLRSGAREFLVRLAERVVLLPGRAPVVFIDPDSMLRPVYGKKKRGASYGHAKVSGRAVLRRGLSPMIATISTPDVAPVIGASMLRAGKASPARGAAIIKEAIGTARAMLDAQRTSASEIVVRADSAFYNRKVIRACIQAGVRFSVTARIDSGTYKAIGTISDDAWTDITYAQPIWDEHERRFVTSAQVAEVGYTAFASREAVTARLIVRRVPRLTPHAQAGQEELFRTWRYHAVFTDSPFVLVQAEAQHRDHAIIEQTNAELINGALAHLPSGSFDANNAWLTMAAIAHNLTRAAGKLAGDGFAKARTATIRHRLFAVAGRLAHHARTLTMHLPQYWPWQHAHERLLAGLQARPQPT